MDFPDLINASFELFGSIAVFISCMRAKKDRQIRGVSPITVGFFTAWGLWNIFYYPHLGQSLSFYCGIAVVFANTYWVCLIFKYRKE